MLIFSAILYSIVQVSYNLLFQGYCYMDFFSSLSYNIQFFSEHFGLHLCIHICNTQI